MICPFCGHENPPGEEVCEDCLQDLADLSHPKPRGPVAEAIVSDSIERLEAHPVLSVPSGATVAEAVRRMNESETGAILVVGADGSLAGIVTERDILFKCPPGTDLATTPVTAVMTADPEAVGHDATIAFVLHKMAVGGFRHVPALRGGRPAAIVSVRDILGYFARHLS